jgi:prepilin-type N-terminal cleavage/methylation domain-containing protein
MKTKTNKAFSLIELSIVILIIGILIAGVTQSSRLLAQSRIRTGQTLTQSSPANAVKNMVLWLETSNEESFLSTQVEDGTNLTQWNDRNSQSSNKYYGVKTGSAVVTYKTDGINGLPTVYFNGTTGANSFFTLSSTPASVGTTAAFIPTTSNAFTFFVVSKLDPAVTSATAGTRGVLYNGDSTANGWGYAREGAAGQLHKRFFSFGTTTVRSTAVSFTNNAEVVSGTYTVTSTGNVINLFVNGVAETITPTSATAVTPTVSTKIGSITAAGTEAWFGFISEIIIFDGAIKNSDRLEIERYLGKKYGIKVQ